MKRDEYRPDLPTGTPIAQLGRRPPVHGKKLLTIWLSVLALAAGEANADLRVTRQDQQALIALAKDMRAEGLRAANDLSTGADPRDVKQRLYAALNRWSDSRFPDIAKSAFTSCAAMVSDRLTLIESHAGSQRWHEFDEQHRRYLVEDDRDCAAALARPRQALLSAGEGYDVRVE